MDGKEEMRKGETLIFLKDKIKSAKVPPSYLVTFKDFRAGKVSLPFAGPYAVRSSAKTEDSDCLSNAGKYESLLNVSASNLLEAIGKVFESYDTLEDDDIVLIQPMLKDVRLAGVAFTCDPKTLSPYIVVNYTETSDTSYVTSGKGGKLLYFVPFGGYYRQSPVARLLFPLVRELAEIFSYPLDIEFAVCNESDLCLLQVRPLVVKGEIFSVDELKYYANILSDKIKKGFRKHPFIKGNRTIYGVMPDWNPAEIIGRKPRELALSLYRELITDNIWAYQRDNYGYRNLRSFPLMIDLFGLPYIDVRVSFNSFIPKSLNDGLAEKLANYYLETLRNNPHLHDKVEFEVVFSCYTFDLEERLKVLEKHGFLQEEIAEVKHALHGLTANIIHPESGLWRKDAERINVLLKRREEILKENDLIAKIYWLIEDTKRWGTLPFAGLARAGFIAVQILKSLVTVGVFSKEDYQNFLKGVKTIATRMKEDRQTFSLSEFLKHYGHLRPGTYDITSFRYDENPEFLKEDTLSLSVSEEKDFQLCFSKLKNLKALLENHNFNFDVVDFLDFLKSAIELREWAKFEFTKNVSDIFKFIEELGKQHGIPRSELAYLNILSLKELYVKAEDIEKALQESIKCGKSRYEVTLHLYLPPLIKDENDVFIFEVSEDVPVFVTNRRVEGEVMVLGRDVYKVPDLEGKIVLIESADPGFDWLFSHGIIGFITCYGGANSHMAIRAGELEIPAVVGVGEILFERLKKSQRALIDCATEKVEI